MNKWITFIQERFNPVVYLVTIALFLGAHYVVVGKFGLLEQEYTTWYLVPLFVALIAFFLVLRILDEVKDLEVDRIHHPERPLPRGVLQVSEMLRVAFVLVIVMVGIFSLYGWTSFVWACVTSAYIYTMYKEFFIKSWLRAHLTTYAVTHTLVVVGISSALISAMSHGTFWFSDATIYFSLAGWFLFNIFEFGRKTYATDEEREGVDSYSKIFGRSGSVLLVLVTALASLYFIQSTGVFGIISYLYVPVVGIGLLGIVYIFSNINIFAQIYRAGTSLYIMVVYALIFVL